MNTSKGLIGLTLAFVVTLLLCGIYYPTSFAMNFANPSLAYEVIRAFIAVLLVSLLVTTPPRSFVLRAFLGAWSIALTVLSIKLVLDYQMNVLDAVAFIEVAIIFGIEALETSPLTRTIPVHSRPSKRHKVRVLSTQAE